MALYLDLDDLATGTLRLENCNKLYKNLLFKLHAKTTRNYALKLCFCTMAGLWSAGSAIFTMYLFNLFRVFLPSSQTLKADDNI